jgi:hypothetical protein
MVMFGVEDGMCYDGVIDVFCMSCGTIVIIDVHHSMLSIVMWNYM